MVTASGKTVGFVGLGAMGGHMAANVLKAGFGLIVNDRRPELATSLIESGASWAETARDVAERSDVVFTCLPNLHAIEDVLIGTNGLMDGLRNGQAVFEMSTNSLELARKLHAALAEKGAILLEAPVSGGATGAKRGRLAIWAGGDLAAFEMHRDVLLAIGDRPLHVGPFGAGLITKLVHNCTSQAVQAAIAEVFVMGVKAGAEPLALWEAVRQGALGRRRTFDQLIDQFLPGTYDDAHAALRIIQKDMTLALDLANELDLQMPISMLAMADVEEAMERGWADRDCRSVMLLPQERAGVHIAVDPKSIAEVLKRDPAAPTDTKHGIEEG
jgi:3-hydroxyisobutyrate dehydrogenase-like beta-hydroxyacid dehydrogenase